MTHDQGSENVVAGVTEVTPASHPVRIKKRRFAMILEHLYRALIHEQGLFATVKMATHAPQFKYYPGYSFHEETINPEQSMFWEVPKKASATVERETPLFRRWLWHAVHGDVQDTSEQVYRAHCKLFADHPEFYHRDVLDISIEKFVRLLKEKDALGKSKYKVADGMTVATRWQRCARTLYEEFEGDPVVLLKHGGWSVEGVYAWKKREEKKRGYDPLPGWGRKLISLYFLYVAEIGFVLPNDAFPADLHAQALLLQTGSIDWGDKDTLYSAPLAEMIRKFATDLCVEKKWDPILLSHAQWLQGSALCNGCANNKLVPTLCAIYDKCGGRIDTGSYAAGKWHKNNRVHTKSGERPKFGLPTDSPVRLTRARKRKLQVLPVVPETIPLFPKK